PLLVLRQGGLADRSKWGAEDLGCCGDYVKSIERGKLGLALIVSSESVFLTIFVLVSQGRMARQSERRSHLDLQVGMLSEQELTTILQMLQKLCQHMGVDVNSSKQEVQSFTKTTDVHKLATELDNKLPEK